MTPILKQSQTNQLVQAAVLQTCIRLIWIPVVMLSWQRRFLTFLSWRAP